MIVYLDPDQHGEKGTPFPFWLRFLAPISGPEWRRLKAKLNDTLGEGSGQVWGDKDKEGYANLMFRTVEDRDLARLLL